MKNACNATATVHLICEPPFYSSWIKATPGVYSHDEGDCYATFKAANARTAYSISAQQLAYLVLPITEIEGQEIATQRFNRDVSFARQQVSQAERVKNSPVLPSIISLHDFLFPAFVFQSPAEILLI